MKNAIIAFGFCVCILLCIVIHSAITAKDVTANESEKSLSIAVEQALSVMTIEPVYSVEELNKLMDELGTNIQAQLSSDSKLNIRLTNTEWEKGIYTLEFIETFKLSNGNTSIAKVIKEIHTEDFVREKENATENETTI